MQRKLKFHNRNILVNIFNLGDVAQFWLEHWLVTPEVARSCLVVPATLREENTKNFYGLVDHVG